MNTNYIIIISLVIILVVAGMMTGCPPYNVWVKGLSGKALLAEASFSKQILVEEAQAQNIAAIDLAQARIKIAEADATAEVKRAAGVAESIGIVGDVLKNNEAYLLYLWVQGLHDGSSEVIYIPTEANLPVLEAGRFTRLQKMKSDNK